MNAALALALVVGTLAVTACGGDDTITLTEWVDRFDATCLEVMEELSDPALTDTEFAAINDRAVDKMRATPEPDMMADTAAQLLDDIAAGADANLTDAEIEALDQAVFDGMNKLGATTCIAGVPG